MALALLAVALALPALAVAVPGVRGRVGVGRQAAAASIPPRLESHLVSVLKRIPDIGQAEGVRVRRWRVVHRRRRWPPAVVRWHVVRRVVHRRVVHRIVRRRRVVHRRVVHLGPGPLLRAEGREGPGPRGAEDEGPAAAGVRSLELKKHRAASRGAHGVPELSTCPALPTNRNRPTTDSTDPEQSIVVYQFSGDVCICCCGCSIYVRANRICQSTAL